MLKARAGVGLILSAMIVVSLGACSSKDSPEKEPSEGSGGKSNASGGSSSGGESSSGGRASGGAGGEGSGGEDAAGGNNTGGDGLGGEGGSGPCYCYEDDLTWNRTGPFGGEKDTITFSSCETIHFLRDYSSSEQPDIACEVEVDSCAEEVSPTDVKVALTHPDVVAAFEAAPLTYGKANPHASVFTIDLNGAPVTLRSDCGDTPACENAPESLIELRNLLVQLGELMAERPECAN